MKRCRLPGKGGIVRFRDPAKIKRAWSYDN